MAAERCEGCMLDDTPLHLVKPAGARRMSGRRGGSSLRTVLIAFVAVVGLSGAARAQCLDNGADHGRAGVTARRPFHLDIA